MIYLILFGIVSFLLCGFCLAIAIKDSRDKKRKIKELETEKIVLNEKFQRQAEYQNKKEEAHKDVHKHSSALQ